VYMRGNMGGNIGGEVIWEGR